MLVLVSTALLGCLDILGGRKTRRGVELRCAREFQDFAMAVAAMRRKGKRKFVEYCESDKTTSRHNSLVAQRQNLMITKPCLGEALHYYLVANWRLAGRIPLSIR